MSRKQKKVKPPVRGYQRHNLTGVIKAVKKQGLSALDQRSAVAKAAAKLRAELVADLGGSESLSVMQHKLIDEFLKKFVLLESIDEWLFQQPSLLNKRTKTLYPVVIQRMTIGDSLVRCLEKLGLEKKAKKVPNINDYLKQSGSNQ